MIINTDWYLYNLPIVTISDNKELPLRDLLIVFSYDFEIFLEDSLRNLEGKKR